MKNVLFIFTALIKTVATTLPPETITLVEIAAPPGITTGSARQMMTTLHAPRRHPHATILRATPRPAPPTLNWAPVTDKDPLWQLLQATFQVINASNSNLTQSCWLCYGARPPYYEGIAINDTYTMSSSFNGCRYQHDAEVKLTLQSVKGQGLCIGKVPESHRHLCVKTIQPTTSAYVIPSNNTWWACSTGLTPCIHTQVLNRSQDYCVQVRLWPKIFYHTDTEIYQSMEGGLPSTRVKREPITAITLSLLLGLGVAGTSTGITSLVLQNQYYGQLRAAIDVDIERIENSISLLQDSLTSLAEVVLQNRRGLDLLLLQQGGVCAALGEECCFYADHSGVVKESMAKVREGLAKRKQERENKMGWFDSWSNTSPWLVTLVSTLMGPLAVLLLLLTVGPCLLNKLLTFVRDRISAVQVMVLRSQYHSCQETSLDFETPEP